MGHVKMMAATQPFISGAISKTVNMPEASTVEDIIELYTESWKMGVKALAIYRDGSKTAQPLATKTDETEPMAETLLQPVRRRLPLERQGVGRKFQVGEYGGYIHVGLFEDGTPGDMFVDIAKEGTTLAGLMNSLMISVSLGLQYGVPLEVYVQRFSHMRFEPSGFTNDEDIRNAKSIVDYIFRWMEKIPDSRSTNGTARKNPLLRCELDWQLVTQCKKQQPKMQRKLQEQLLHLRQSEPLQPGEGSIIIV